MSHRKCYIPIILHLLKLKKITTQQFPQYLFLFKMSNPENMRWPIYNFWEYAHFLRKKCLYRLYTLIQISNCLRLVIWTHIGMTYKLCKDDIKIQHLKKKYFFNMWHVTRDMWQRGGDEHWVKVSAFSSNGLCFKDFEENHQSLIYWRRCL